MDNIIGPPTSEELKEAREDAEFSREYSKSFYEREYKRLKAIEDEEGQENLILKCDLSVAENKIKDLKYEVSELKSDGIYAEELREQVADLEKSRDSYDSVVRKKYYQEYKDSSFSETLREELRQQYQKRFNDEQTVFEWKLGLMKKSQAKKINENKLLKADVRRLEKLCKNLAEDNMMLQNPPIDGSTFEFMDVRDIVHNAAMSRLSKKDEADQYKVIDEAMDSMRKSVEEDFWKAIEAIRG